MTSESNLVNHCRYGSTKIREQAKIKIAKADFAVACREGNVDVMRRLIIGLWPFVDEFPKSIIRAASLLPKLSLFKERELLNALLHRGYRVLSGIKNDEENHRELWLETGDALGLSFPSHYRQPVLAETQKWLDAVNAQTEPATTFVRLAVIEIIAEVVSLEFLASTAFTSVLGERGCEWFRVHAEHEPGMTHEELELRLAFALYRGEIGKEHISIII